MTAWPSVDPQGVAALPLRGLRVLDLSRILAGPFAAMVLSDLGADVIKVERPGTGDDTRRWGPPFRGAESTYFLSVNRNRRSITLNLETEEGREILERLAREAHLVLENFLPHQLTSLGLNELREANPHLGWVSIRAASSEGPLGALPGFDAMVQARSGLMSITGNEEHATKVGVAIADVIAGLHAAVAALSLLVAKGTFTPEENGSEPSVVEVPLLECALSALVNQASNYLLAGVVPQRLGNEHPNLAPYASYSCADGDVVVGAGTDRQFQGLAAAIGRAELVDDPRFSSNAVRIANRQELNALIAELLATETRATWGERFDRAKVPWAPVNDIAEAFGEEHVRAIGLVAEVPNGDDPLPQVRSPFKIDGVRPELRTAPPGLGQHTDSILEHLGYGTRLAELRAAGVV
jgi:crotonobetainyl-CoA:carnitine CoA-transferase CaiB-like acyl-CoA transferase